MDGKKWVSVGMRAKGGMLLGLWWLLTLPASAQVALESVSNATVANSGPTANGPSTASQAMTLRHNTNNPTGNTMVVRTPAITATVSLTNQQFTGLTAAQGYPASTGGNAVFFGGSPATTGNAPGAYALYAPLNSFGTPAATDHTSVNATTGQGIDVAVNAGAVLGISTHAIAIRAPSTPLNARVRMADVVITFNVPVNNPILHLGGMGGLAAAPANGGPLLGITAEFDLDTTTGQTLTRLSGNTNFVVSGAQINNGATNPSGTCTGAGAACGSVRVNGTGITVITLRAYVRGNGATGSAWNGAPGTFSLDGVLIGVSVNEPTPTLTVSKISNGGVGTFNFTGSNGFAAQAITTVTAGTAASGTTQTLTAAGTATTITEAAVAGYALTGITCTGLGAGGTATTNLATRTVTLNAAATALGSDIRCTFTNSVPTADLSIQKTATPNPAPTNGQVQFTLVVTNQGPAAANGASVRDPAVAGLDCTAAGLPAPTCSATSGTSCPSPLTATGLQAGVPIPTLPNAGVVTIGLTCRVTASGF